MSHTDAIFIFTRDRSNTLIETLTSLHKAPYIKYVIDDSNYNHNQKSVASICKSFTNCKYLGKEEFNQFTNDYCIDLSEFNFLLRELGNESWNLGYSRNFALLYSKANHYSRVLFTDDDIRVPDLKLIDKLFLLLNQYQFVGANICGLVDDSVLGHIATDVGVTNERMLSGGFLVFNPNKIDHFFLNNYNEDWIWLFFQLIGKKHLQTGEVFQELSDPLTNYKDKVIFQEFGEIILDGVLDLYNRSSFNELTQLSFWERMLTERKEYLDLLLLKSKKEENKRYIDIIEFIQSNSENFKAAIFKNLFNEFFYNRNLFQELFKSIF